MNKNTHTQTKHTQRTENVCAARPAQSVSLQPTLKNYEKAIVFRCAQWKGKGNIPKGQATDCTETGATGPSVGVKVIRRRLATRTLATPQQHHRPAPRSLARGTVRDNWV